MTRPTTPQVASAYISFAIEELKDADEFEYFRAIHDLENAKRRLILIERGDRP